MNAGKLVLLAIIVTALQACAGPGKPGEASLAQPSTTPSNDYMYRSPPPAVAQALR